jgi:hypothetical protein
LNVTGDFVSGDILSPLSRILKPPLLLTSDLFRFAQGMHRIWVEQQRVEFSPRCGHSALAGW